MTRDQLCTLADAAAKLLTERYPDARLAGVMVTRLPVRWVMVIGGVRPDDSTVSFVSTTDIAPQATYDDALAAFLRDCANLE